MAKQELLATIRDRYRASSRKEKSRILDEFIAVTSHHRKHGIRLLGQSGDDWEQRSPNAAGTPTAMGVALNPCGDWRPYLSVSRLMYSLYGSGLEARRGRGLGRMASGDFRACPCGSRGTCSNVSAAPPSIVHG